MSNLNLGLKIDREIDERECLDIGGQDEDAAYDASRETEALHLTLDDGYRVLTLCQLPSAYRGHKFYLFVDRAKHTDEAVVFASKQEALGDRIVMAELGIQCTRGINKVSFVRAA